MTVTQSGSTYFFGYGIFLEKMKQRIIFNIFLKTLPLQKE